MTGGKTVLTIATGKKLYVDMAVNLARSFRLWHQENDEISFHLATDLPQCIPDNVKNHVRIIQLEPDQLGKGFSPKLHLDKLAPPGQTLFIDSDCLVYSNLNPVFEAFKGHNVSVAGTYIAGGEWFGDVASVCKKFDIPHLPKFNGGLYYLEAGPKSKLVYETARKLEKEYDDIGFVRLRNHPNDEVLMALAMELNHESPVTDDGSILAEFVNFQSGIKSDLLNGTVKLYNDPAHPDYQKNWHLTLASPVVVHYLGHHNMVMPYIREVRQLKYIMSDGYPIGISRFLTFLGVTLPAEIAKHFKNILRPVYKTFMGTRQVKKSERIVD
ncbi:MAG TPA: hypothetical protein VG367_17840 [Mucilaginibacter sp.]|nr:hypothetical protein [Mucilaginibacter sp.]